MHPGIYETVLRWIPEKSRVLDLGAGDGAFLARLIQTRQVAGEGVEKDPALVARCVERGLVVHQGDIADGLDQYGDRTFDFVLLLGTFQELVSPANILQEAFRVGRHVVIAHTNFAHFSVRLQVLSRGRTPMTQFLPSHWYHTQNLHFFSILDFQDFCREAGIREVNHAYFNARGTIRFLPNLRAEEAVSRLQADAISQRSVTTERGKTKTETINSKP
jgi:methionine biosynthesis protein MetW